MAGEWQTWEVLTGQDVKEFTLVAEVEVENGEWTWRDTALETAWAAFWLVDWKQTQQIARGHWEGSRDDRFKIHETNRFLGREPTTGRVNSYFATCLVLHPVISYALPKPYKTIWQGITVIYEADMVQDNRDLGLGVSLGW